MIDIRESLYGVIDELRDKLEASRSREKKLLEILRYVAYQRLPLGNTVIETLPEHWQQKVETALNEGK